MAISPEVIARPKRGLHPPFAPGNEVAKKAGSWAAEWRLAPRSVAIADSIRPLIPDFEPGDEIQLRLLALALTRIELASEWLAEQKSIVKPGKSGDLWPVAKELPKWEAQATRHLTALGLSPQARRGGDRSSAEVLAAYLADHAGGDET